MTKSELSIQITNPSFLSDRFTTQIDLLTGNPFYESQWGKLFAILPPEIAEDIAREIWRECFTRVVLKPPHEYDYWCPIRQAKTQFQNKGDCLLHLNKYPVCHCFNKDGRMCGVNDATDRYLAWDSAAEVTGQTVVMNVPQMTCGVSKSQTAMTGYVGGEQNRIETRHTKVKMCDKHAKEMRASGDACDYVNKMLTKWGWGERNGYPIRVGDGYKTDIKYSARLQKKLDNNQYGEFKWRKPIRDYVVVSEYERIYEQERGVVRTKRLNRNCGRYIDPERTDSTQSASYEY